ncbi:hypothetical protein M1D45_21815 (plasmid) [Bacillus sp. SA116]|uniref:hypothetical protein n=1 Tax=Bacillus TaxID=1386 RepID=UPI0008C0866E|nr:hypothetical protein [Bacillus]KAA0930105.1 hypothetical protein FQ086_21390 [Bacillus sp. ANT_WA51]QHM12339.1 hypothetical protein C7M28_04166 [Bacillus subtilis]TDO84498.1 hypothetical protein BDW29_4287 [Bacillus sp. AtDRG31]TWG49442.1 hypothetical protein L608_000900000260 [Bacillus subtilis J23]CAF1847325.1 hypothetical protein NRS6132_04042 [Bacillus subtilis]
MNFLNDLDWWKHLATNVGGVLTAILGFLSILNLHFDWFSPGSIDAFTAIIVAIGTLFVGSFSTVVNTYLTKRSKEKAKQVAYKYDTELVEKTAKKSN